jgi:flagellar hook assembly protein FlgD
MRSQSSVTISIGKGQTSRFVVTAKQQATTPLSISGLRMVAPSGRSSGRSFIFNVSREASVTAKVTTLSGKVIATLATGRAVSAGENRLNWTSRAETGAALAPGPYLVEIVAQDGDGEVAPARQPFVIIE